MDVLLLSRLQFATNISFHILFPTITIALCWFLYFFKLRYEKTGDTAWLACYRFWVKIFALTFALGVVSGITMSFQFGTNWPGFMETVGNIAGPLLGYEVLTAFFMEATFLSVMLFGANRVSTRVHNLAILLVAIGTSLSAFWILALNSWMQTPQGFEMIDGVAHPTDWWAIIFNPSFPYRFFHMFIASGLTASFLILGVSSYRYLIGDKKAEVLKAIKASVVVAVVLTPVQIVLGDFHGLNSFEHQPAKIAAVEGVWHTEKGAPLLLFAIPDQEQQKNHFEIGVPNLASLILTHELDGEIQGLNEFPEQQPPVFISFWSFRIMVGIGLLMLLLSSLNLYRLLRRGDLKPWLLKANLAMTFSGWIATLAGWYVTEVGRQPWLVTGVLKTADAATSIAPQNVGLSLTLFILVYGFLLITYVHTVFLLARKARKNPMLSESTAQESH